MVVPISQAVLVALVLYGLWRTLRLFFVKSSLSNIPGPPKASWWKGNFHRFFDRQGWNFHHDIVRQYGNVVKLHMLLGDEQIAVSDPLALHHIVVKDQYVYEETDAFIVGNGLLLGKGLLSTLGDHHRKQRKMLNPVFSLKHMRGLIPVFNPIAHQLRDILTNHVSRGEKEINVMKWLSRAALEYIGQGGLGYTFNALDEAKKDTYSETLKSFGPLNFSLFLYRQALPHLVKIGSPSFRRAIVDVVPWNRLQQIKVLADTLENISREVFENKVSNLQKGNDLAQVGQGKDIMSVLLKANWAAKEEDKLPEDEVFGQMNGFILAAHDTTTSALCRILHLLCQHTDVQEKARAEVTAARMEAGGDLDYDTLMGLPYLDAVCRETLRVYPPVTSVQRTTRKDIVLPLMWPIKSADGKSTIKEIPLKKNTGVIVHILAANRNKTIWGEDAEDWKPDRWLKPLPESVAKAHMPGVYASMMTFIGGGRACIGFKFAEMEMKLVLSVLLEKFIFAEGSKEILWNMGGISNPVVKGSGIIPQLPLKVSFVKQ